MADMPCALGAGPMQAGHEIPEQDAELESSAIALGLRLVKIASGFWALNTTTYNTTISLNSGCFTVRVKFRRWRTLGRWKRLDRALASLVSECLLDPTCDGFIKRSCVSCRGQVYADGLCACGYCHPKMTWA